MTLKQSFKINDQRTAKNRTNQIKNFIHRENFAQIN